MKKVFSFLLVIVLCLFLFGCSKDSKNLKEDKKESKQETKKDKDLKDPFVECSLKTDDYDEDVKIYYNETGITTVAIFEKYDSAETAESIFEIYNALAEDGQEFELDGDTMIIYMTPDYFEGMYDELTVDAIKDELINTGYACK